MGNRENLSILGHLAEFRTRLVKCVIALVITSIISFIFANQIFHVLLIPAHGVNLIYIDMTEMIGIYMKICLSAGVILALPFLLYQILMFLAPALTPQEKKYVMIILPWVALMFVAGVLFSYYIMLPPAINILTTFGSEIAAPQIRIGSYIDVVTRMLLGTGGVFELPVFSTFLARLGIVNYRWLASKRKFAIVGAFIIGAIITPTLDPINQTFISLPLIALYEMSIWLAKFVQRRPSRIIVTQPTIAS